VFPNCSVWRRAAPSMRNTDLRGDGTVTCSVAVETGRTVAVRLGQACDCVPVRRSVRQSSGIFQKLRFRKPIARLDGPVGESRRRSAQIAVPEAGAGAPSETLRLLAAGLLETRLAHPHFACRIQPDHRGRRRSRLDRRDGGKRVLRSFADMAAIGWPNSAPCRSSARAARDGADTAIARAGERSSSVILGCASSERRLTAFESPSWRDIDGVFGGAPVTLARASTRGARRYVASKRPAQHRRPREKIRHRSSSGTDGRQRRGDLIRAPVAFPLPRRWRGMPRLPRESGRQSRSAKACAMKRLRTGFAVLVARFLRTVSLS